jgi:pimeloyl-ACP methyl ester carboxylesterase
MRERLRARPASDALPYLERGDGAPLVILHGFGLTPRTYAGLADALSARCRVIVPALFELHGRWSYDRTLRTFAATVDALVSGPVTLVGHSWGGAIEIGYASRHVERIRELVFVDTLAASHFYRLAAEAFHPMHAMHMATPSAAQAFLLSSLRHPLKLSRAGWWAFSDDRTDSAELLADAGVRSHVLWANRDTILSRADGHRFARELHATFTVARADGLALDHDWMYRHPQVFRRHLEKLGVWPPVPGDAGDAAGNESLRSSVGSPDTGEEGRIT